MGIPGYLVSGYAIQNGDTRNDISTSEIFHIGKDNIVHVMATAAALAGRAGSLEIRGSNHRETVKSPKEDWSLIAAVAVGVGLLNTGTNTPLTGIEFLWVEYIWTGGGQDLDLDVFISKKRM